MSTFKYSQGKLVEQPTMEKPIDDSSWVATAWIAANKKYQEHISSLRTYIAEGNFLEDELVEEKDLDFITQVYVLGSWYDTKIYDRLGKKSRRIIARRKVITKEEGEKPDCSQHKRDLFGETDMKKVAEAIGDLHYETLSELLDKLGDKLIFDSTKDMDRGREHLATNLHEAGMYLWDAHEMILKAWQISKPFMKPNNLT